MAVKLHADSAGPVVVVAVVAIALGGCSSGASPEASPAPVPPTAEYVPAKPWSSRHEPELTVPPPDPAKETWRVRAHRYAPMQTETPRWQPLPAADNVVVQMHADSRFRCLVTPLSVAVETDDFGTQVEAWILERELRCSSDGWRSWTAHPHRVRVDPEGARLTQPARASLREQGRVQARETLVSVRDDPEKRRATKGPPRVVAAARADDD